MQFAHGHENPWFHEDVDEYSRERIVKDVVQWLQGEGSYDHDEYVAQPPMECVLNVAGSRESKADGIQELVMEIMVDVIRQVNPDCKNVYPLA